MAKAKKKTTDTSPLAMGREQKGSLVSKTNNNNKTGSNTKSQSSSSSKQPARQTYTNTSSRTRTSSSVSRGSQQASNQMANAARQIIQRRSNSNRPAQTAREMQEQRQSATKQNDNRPAQTAREMQQAREDAIQKSREASIRKGVSSAIQQSKDPLNVNQKQTVKERFNQNNPTAAEEAKAKQRTALTRADHQAQKSGLKTANLTAREKENEERMNKTAAGRIVYNAPERWAENEEKYFTNIGVALSDYGEMLNGTDRNKNGRLAQDMGDLLPDSKKLKNQFGQATKDYMAKRDELEAKAEARNKNAGRFERNFYSAEESGQGMLTDYILGTVTAPVGGWAVPLWLRSYGGERGKAEELGATTTEDRLNSALNATIEYATEKIGGFFGKGGGKFAKEGAGRLVGRDFKSALKLFVKTGGEEHLEEIIANPSEHLGENLIYRNRLQREREAQNDQYFADIAAGIQEEFANNPTEVERYIAAVNSAETREEFVKDFKDGGMTDEQANAVADKMIEFMVAAAQNDTAKMKAIKESLADDLVGDARMKIWDWNEQLDVALSTWMVSGVGGAGAAINSYQQGQAIKSMPNANKRMMNALEKIAAFDPKNSGKSQAMLDAMKNEGYEPTATQAYEIMVDESQVMAKTRDNQIAANQIKEKEVKAEGITVPVATYDANGDYRIEGKVSAERYAQRYTDTLEYIQAIDDSTYNEKTNRNDAMAVAETVASYEVGTLNIAETANLSVDHPENRYVFQEMTGVDLNQYNVYDKNGKIDKAASNMNMQEKLLAMSSQNYIESARLEQLNWNDEERGKLADAAGRNLNPQGDLALHDALNSVDPRDYSKFMLMGQVASEVYSHSYYTQDSWEDVKKHYQKLYPSLDIGVLEGMYESAKTDRAEAETPYLNAEVEAGKPMGKTKKGKRKGQVRGRFINETPYNEETGEGRDLTNNEAAAIKQMAKDFNVDVVQIDAEDERLRVTYQDENGETRYDTNEAGEYRTANAKVDFRNNVIYISNAAPVEKILHEIVHETARLAAPQYIDMAHYILDAAYKYDAEGTQDMLDHYHQLYAGQGLTDAQIEEEVVADLVAKYMHDPKFFRAIANENLTALQKIKNAIDDVIRAIRNFISSGYFADENQRNSLLNTLGIYTDVRNMMVRVYDEARSAQAEEAINETQDQINAQSAERLSLKNENITINSEIPYTEVTQYVDVDYGDKKALDSLQNEADSFLKSLKGQKLKNIATGYEALVTTAGRKKMLNPAPRFNPYKGNYVDNLNAVLHLPELFENAVYIDTKPYQKGKSGKASQDYLHFVSPIIIKGEEKRALITARESAGSNTIYIVDTEVIPNGKGAFSSSYATESMKTPSTVSVTDLVRNVKIHNYDTGVTDNYGVYDIKFSLSDEDYMTAVNAGNMEEAQRMVDEAAEKAGYNIKAYHGTAEDFNKFSRAKWGSEHRGYLEYGAGFYFTPSEEEADRWAKRGRSGYAGKDTKVMSVYLSSARAIKADDPIPGGSQVLQNMGLGEADANFIAARTYRFINYLLEDKGFDNVEVQDELKSLGFDAVDATYGEWVGKPEGQFVVFDPEQIKSADPITYDDEGNVIPLSQRFNPETEDVRFSLKEPVERAGDLIAVHNLKPTDIINTFKLGGFPMPSIAVTKDSMGHDLYGDISLLFHSDTIDPQASRYNEVYGGDAWTPTFPAVKKLYSQKKAKEIAGKLKDILGIKNEYQDLPKGIRFPDFDQENLSNKLDYTTPGEAYTHGSGSEVMKLAYLKNAKNFDVAIPMKEGNIRGMDKQNLEYLDDKLPELTYDDIFDTVQRTMEYEPAVREARKAYYESKGNPKLLKALSKQLDEEMGYSEVQSRLQALIDYRTNGMPEVIDDPALDKIFSDNINTEEYQKWVDDLYDGIVEKEGVRNNKDMFMSNGNRRSWESLHDPVTLDNVVRIMRSELAAGSNGLFGANPVGASQKKYASLDEIRADEDRLQQLPEKEYEALKDAATEEFTEVCGRIVDANPGRFSNKFGSLLDTGEFIAEILNTTRDKNRIQKKLKADYWLDVSDDIMDDLMAAIDKMASVPTGYFEAKPRRAVGLREVKAAIIPSELSAADEIYKEIRDELELLEIPIYEYKYSKEGDRARAVNEAATEQDLRFSLKDDSEGHALSEGQQEYFNNSKVLDNEGRLKVMYHGTPELGFTVFNYAKTKPGTLGRGFYFSDSPSHAGNHGQVMEVYLNIENPLEAGTNNITKDQLRAFVERLAEDEDYGIENYGYGSTVDSVTEAVWGGTDFQMMHDLNLSCVGDLAEACRIFNEVNGTDYDGIITPVETLAMRPEQIKFTDNLEPTSDIDMRYSLDDEYMAAVESGDMETAQKLVEIAAKEAGKSLKVYHGTTAEDPFYVFRKPSENTRTYSRGSGFTYVSPSYDYAEGYSIEQDEEIEWYAEEGRVMEGFINTDNMLNIGNVDHSAFTWTPRKTKDGDEVFEFYWPDYNDEEAINSRADEQLKAVAKIMGMSPYEFVHQFSEAEYEEIKEGMHSVFDFVNSPQLADFVRDKGYEGIKLEEWGEEAYGLLESNQFKSADPVTYAEDGSVIPLSQRFDPTNDDIRYSLPTQDTEGRVLSDGQMEYFKNSEARGEDGKLAVVYHTTNAGGFTVFDPEYSDDNLSLFFTSNFNMSQSYGTNAFRNIMREGTESISFDDFIKMDGPSLSTVVSTRLIDLIDSETGEVVWDGTENPVGTGTALSYWYKKDTKGYLVSVGGETMDREGFDRWMNEQAEDILYGYKNHGYYECYLNLQDPLVIDCKGSNWDSIQEEGFESLFLSYDGESFYVDNTTVPWTLDEIRGQYGVGFAERAEEWIESADPEDLKMGDTLYTWYGGPFDPEVEGHWPIEGNTRYWCNEAADLDYDGVIFRNLKDNGPYGNGREIGDVYVAFSSEQIKDINNLDPTNNPDIRYSIVDDDEAMSYAAHDDAYDDSWEAMEYYESVLSSMVDIDLDDGFINHPMQVFLENLKKYGETDAKARRGRDKSKYRETKFKNEEDWTEAFYEGLTWQANEMRFDDPVLEEGRTRMAKSRNDFFNSTVAKWNQGWVTDGSVLDINSIKKPVRDLVAATMQGSDTDRKYNSDTVKKTLIDMRLAYWYAQQGRIEIADALLWHTAHRMIENVEFYADDSVFNEYKDLRQYLRTTRIQLGEEYWADVDYQAFRKANFGRLKLVSGETNVDQIYAELEELFPGLFNSEEYTTPPDQLMHMAAVLDSIQPYKEAYSSEECAALATEIASDLLDIMQNEGQAIESVADKYEAKIQAMRTRHAEAMLKVREQRDRGIKAEKAKFKEYVAKQKEKTLHKKHYQSIQKNYKKLTERLLTNTADKNIPEQYKKELAKVLAAFDLQTVGSKKYEARTGRKSQKTIRMGAMIAALNNIEAKSGEFHLNDAITDIIDELLGADTGNGHNRSIEGLTIDELNSSELARIDNLLKALLHEFNTYKTVKVNAKRQQVEDIGKAQVDSALKHAEEFGVGKDYNSAIGILDRVVNLDEMTAAYLFRRIDPENEGLGLMFKELRRSFDHYVRNTAQLNQWMENILGKYQNHGKFGPGKYGSDQIHQWRSFNYARTLNLENGSVQMTPAQMMSVYCLGKRAQAYNHMTGAGIVVAPNRYDAKLINDIKQKANTALPVKLTDADIKLIENELTADQRKVADDLQQLMANQMAAWGNEASMNVLGIELFNEPDYFPIKSDRAALISDLSEDQFAEAIRSFGFTKAVQPGARNAIMVDDIFAVVAEHCNNMNLYNSYSEAINDFMKVYNYRDVDESRGEYTVKQAIAHAYSQKATAFISRFIKDLNGNVSGNDTGISKMYNDLLSKAKKASVFANGRVALQQPTAIARAFYVINPKYLKGIVTNEKAVKGAMQEMFDHCPIALWKSWGYYDIQMGRTVEDVMMNNGNWIEDLETDLYGRLDNITWTAIWQMVKAEMKDTHPDVKPGTDEYWELCNERMSEVVDLTQVVDSPMHRSHAMRAKDYVAKTATAFMSEPTLTFNMVKDGLIQAKEALQKGNKAKAGSIFAKTMGVFFLQAALVSAMAAIWDAVRGKNPDGDDDDDKSWFTLWWLNALNNFKDELNIFNKIYFAKDIVSLFQGYGISNLALQGWKSIADGFAQLTGTRNVYSSKKWYENFLTGFGYITGKPYGTLFKDLKAIYNMFGLDWGVFNSIGEYLDETQDRVSEAWTNLMGERDEDSVAAGFWAVFDGKKNSAASDGEEKDGKKKSSKAKEKVKSLSEEQLKKLDKKAAKKAKGYEGSDRDEVLWDVLSEGYTKHIEAGDMDYIYELRDIYQKNGGDVKKFDAKVAKAIPSIYKKTFKENMTFEELSSQEEMKEYMLKNGVSEAEISDICYHTDRAKDLKAALRIGNRQYIMDELLPLVMAGLTEEDYEKLIKNKNRGANTYDGKYTDPKYKQSTGTFVWPTEGVITSGFGYRESPTAGASSQHMGIDIGAAQGTPVVAVDGGTVIEAGSNGGYGNSVGIRHDDGTISYYNHLYNWNVQVGDTVGQGQQIGQVGSTGISTGPHLDFRLYKDGEYLNPEVYLNKRS